MTIQDIYANVYPLADPMTMIVDPRYMVLHTSVRLDEEWDGHRRYVGEFLVEKPETQDKYTTAITQGVASFQKALEGAPLPKGWERKVVVQMAIVTSQRLQFGDLSVTA